MMPVILLTVLHLNYRISEICLSLSNKNWSLKVERYNLRESSQYISYYSSTQAIEFNKIPSE
jgi:hypothetical protein